jgi:hypothetical protein
MSGQRPKFGIAAITDLVLALAALGFGIYLVASSWPDPGVWAWVCLAFGVVGVPFAFFNPSARIRKWMYRRMVKR